MLALVRVTWGSEACFFDLPAEAPKLKIEPDHELVWVEPAEALRRLRHASHAWSVVCWLRSA